MRHEESEDPLETPSVGDYTVGRDGHAGVKELDICSTSVSSRPPEAEAWSCAVCGRPACATGLMKESLNLAACVAPKIFLDAHPDSVYSWIGQQCGGDLRGRRTTMPLVTLQSIGEAANEVCNTVLLNARSLIGPFHGKFQAIGTWIGPPLDTQVFGPG